MPPDPKTLTDEDLASVLEEARAALETQDVERKRLSRGMPERAKLWKSVRRLRKQLEPLEREDWNRQAARQHEADSPRIEAFLTDLKAVYEKHQLVIAVDSSEVPLIFEAEAEDDGTGWLWQNIDNAIQHLRDSGI